MGEFASSALILAAAAAAVAFAAFLWRAVAAVSLDSPKYRSISASELGDPENGSGISPLEASFGKLRTIYADIQAGAQAFLKAEYIMCTAFLAVFGAFLFVLVSRLESGWDYRVGFLTALSFVVGGVTSMVAGYLGMMVAVFANARTTICCLEKPESRAWTASFNTAFRAGGVMGYALTGVGILTLYALITVYAQIFDVSMGTEQALLLFECVAGFGLGGSSIALFGRVGGGIYTKAADVGADLAGKVCAGIPEDDPRNPATIADNVGDNVGDVAGMGSDLFGSLGEATCAALVIAAQSQDLVGAGWNAILFPLCVTAVGIFCSMAVSFVATDLMPVRREADVERVLKTQLFLSTAAMTAAVYPVTLFLPANLYMGSEGTFANMCATPEAVAASSDCVANAPLAAFACVAAGLWGGCLIGFITEYYTSHSYRPVREVAASTETGAATNIIYGLALGYKSTIVPVGVLASVIYVATRYFSMYGVALAALGMLGTLPTCLSIDVYGPVCDNAGGIAEMSELPESVRDKTDALDAAGNTTAAIGKGFAIGSAALVSLALTAAFVTRTGVLSGGVNMLAPTVFASLLVGSMLPYWFSALTMKSVGLAAMEMVKEVKRQFDTIPGLLEGTPGHGPPDHARCIKISTDASLREMVAPGLLVILSPIVTGTLFGVQSVAGLLAGGLLSGVQLAISASNTGGAWDNAKKYVEKGCLLVGGVVQRKGGECHKAAVVGDTVGDPLKDTSGPALNILMKLMAIVSLVMCDFFMGINEGRGFFNVGAPN
jgi:inorganic pyrophosphatase